MIYCCRPLRGIQINHFCCHCCNNQKLYYVDFMSYLLAEHRNKREEVDVSCRPFFQYVYAGWARNSGRVHMNIIHKIKTLCVHNIII